jgi:hypothetical protein
MITMQKEEVMDVLDKYKDKPYPMAAFKSVCAQCKIKSGCDMGDEMCHLSSDPDDVRPYLEEYERTLLRQRKWREIKRRIR